MNPAEKKRFSDRRTLLILVLALFSMARIFSLAPLNISAVGAAGIVRLEEEGCQRRCHPDWAHRNIIIFKFRQGDGISDRLFVIENLAYLAGHLCAILYFPPPYKMVSLK